LAIAKERLTQHSRLRDLSTLAVVALVTAACGTMIDDRPSRPTERLMSKAHEYVDLAWTTAGIVSLRLDAKGPVGPSSPTLELHDPDAERTSDLTVSHWTDCQDDLFVASLTTGPDGASVRFLEWCNATTSAAARPAIWQVDTNGLATPLFTPPLGVVQGGQLTVAKDGTHGFFGTGSRICDGILRLDGTRVDDPPILIPADGGPFSVGSSALGIDETCAGGQARAPDISPDGRVLALLASPEAVGVTGLRRLDSRYDIYLVDTATFQVTRVPLSVRDPRDLRWSPAGDRLAMTADFGEGGRALAVLTLATKNVLTIRHGAEGGMAWSPDGKRIAAIVPQSANGDDARLIAILPAEGL
jgi:WD40-like Beta Propeller Repeat